MIRRFGSRRGGGGLMRQLEFDVHSCKNKKFVTAEEIAQHLHLHHPKYRSKGLRTLAVSIRKVLQKSKTQNERVGTDEDKAQNRKRKVRVDEKEERLIQIEHEYMRRMKPSKFSDTGSESRTSSSEVSTSDDGIYGEKFEPEFDVTKSMLRQTYTPVKSSKEENIEMDVCVDAKMIKMMDGDKDLQEEDKFPNDPGKGKQNAGVNMRIKWKNGPVLSDLGGVQEVLRNLEMDVIAPLLQPKLLNQLGVNPISGILLHGPPGCGKTKLAHAIANVAGVPFYSISATDVVSGVSGASEEKIRTLFSEANRTAPSIVFIDEIDAIASKRENLQREMERRIVTQLMICMDKYQKLAKPNNSTPQLDDLNQNEGSGYVLVIGATNRPDVIDPALRRPGRFDREINLGVPDENSRIEILSVLLRKCTLEAYVDLFEIAKALGSVTPGFVGADLDSVVNTAGLVALRRILSQRKEEIIRERLGDELEMEWCKKDWPPEEMEKHAITMDDLMEAAKLVQPSLKREGFSSIPDEKWEDVGGLYHIKKELEDIVGFMKDPKRYQKYGLNLDTGILLYGPPGCGKTLIAKAVANESGANFIYIKGPEFLNKYVGESERVVREKFSLARACAPCIMFFDEVDAVTSTRGEEGRSVSDRILTQLLIELDGADKRPGVFVIGATNRPEMMDPAVLRPGRFSKKLCVPLPNSDERGLILKALSKNRPIDPGVDLCKIGQNPSCESLSGADLKQLINDAAMFALRENADTINASHFDRALREISPSVFDKQMESFKRFEAARK